LALVKASDGSVSARYEYGPFAEPVRITGALADAQPIRFSTKWTDLESGFLYYGYRYYSPSTGRWLSRDPVEELVTFEATLRFASAGITFEMQKSQNTRSLYHFLVNDGVNEFDLNGLQPAAKVPRAGDPCCTEPCKMTATTVHVSVEPVTTGGGCTRRKAASWSATVAVGWFAEGDCPIIGCRYWTCNRMRARENPTAYTPGPCAGWTYAVGGPMGGPFGREGANSHIKAIEGVIDYLSCEGGRYVKRTASGGTLRYGFYYDPAEAYLGGTRIHP
jgi:RHS repeat-associated protein